MTRFIKSPLRYVGSKYWLISKIWDLIPLDTTELCSPCFGGGSLEINLSIHRNIKIYGYDICPHSINFWRYWLLDANGLIEHAKQIVINKKYDELKIIKRQMILEGQTLFEPYWQAVYFYVFNRLSFQGLTYNPYVERYEIVGGRAKKNNSKTPVFNILDDATKKLSHIDVGVADFEGSLIDRSGILAYIDPPYLDMNIFGNKKKIFNHHRLSKILKNRDHWILSYGHLPEVPYIKLVYGDYFMIEFDKQTRFNNAKERYNSTELLIFSHDLTDYIKTQIEPTQLELFNQTGVSSCINID